SMLRSPASPTPEFSTLSLHDGLPIYVLDTALALQIRDGGALLLGGLDRALRAVIARAEEHRRTICIGRSHGIHAEPTTFGWKLADRKSTRLNSSHVKISYAVFCLKKK